MSAKRLCRCVAVSLIAAGPAGGFIFGVLNAGDPDPNPIGRLFYACIMAVVTPLHAGFPPHHDAGAGQSFNAWPHIAVSFLLILSWFVHRDWKSSKLKSEMNQRPNTLALPTIIRLASFVTVGLGAVGSLAFMFRVGRHNPSAILMILFTLWVVAPFVTMVSAPMLFNKWSVGSRAWFHFFTIIVALGSSGIYGDVAFGTPRPQPAFMFLVVPFVSLLGIGAALLIVSLVSRARHDKIA